MQAFQRLILSSFFAVAWGVIATSQAIAAGVVEDELRMVMREDYVEVKAGTYWFKELPGDIERYDVTLKVHNQNYDDIDAYICDQREFQKFEAGRSFRCHGHNRGRGVLQVNAPGGDPLPRYLVLNNSFSILLTKKITYTVGLTARLDGPERQQFQNMAQQISDEIQRMFDVPEFDVIIGPCGQVNAFSTFGSGDIKICSELIFQESERKGVLAGIVFHEIGHSLLHLWGFPGDGNEELVDEFAIVMMHLTGDQGVAYQLAEYFAEVDPEIDKRSKYWTTLFQLFM